MRQDRAPEIPNQHVGESNETPYTDADIRRDILGGVEADVDGDTATKGRTLDRAERSYRDKSK